MQNLSDQIADEILVMDAQSGSYGAFDVLVARWQKRLWWHAYHLTGSPEAAWDVTQEGWLNVVRGLGRLKDPARFGTWVYRIVSHKAYDWLRRNGRESEMASAELPEVVIEQPLQEIRSDVHGVLCRLPFRSQVVLNLYYLEGFGLAEIARILGTPAGTIKSRLHAARAKFRKIWKAVGEVPLKGKTT